MGFDCSPDFTMQKYIRVNPSQKDILLNSNETEIYYSLLEKEYFHLWEFIYQIGKNSEYIQSFYEELWKQLIKKHNIHSEYPYYYDTSSTIEEF